MLGVLLSFGASAKELCFQVQMDYPVAIEVTVQNRLNKIKIERYEMVPEQYLCKSYSKLMTKNLSYNVLGLDSSCSGRILSKGTSTLIINEDGCSLH